MIVDTVVLRKFRAACVSEITVEITAFLPCSLMRETEYNGGRFGCFTAGDVKRSRSILATSHQRISPPFFRERVVGDSPEMESTSLTFGPSIGQS